MVNRIWQRFLGRGIVEPVDDWETATPLHPELLEFLAREFVASGYDAKHLARLILQLPTYQRVPTADVEKARLHAAPQRRRMTAEQVLDSLLATAGKEAHTEEMNVDVYGSRLENSSINLALPTRAWRFTTMGNERDRPSLSLPAAQTAVTFRSKPSAGGPSGKIRPVTAKMTPRSCSQPSWPTVYSPSGPRNSPKTASS